eukprot:4271001-Amphidinium_carterae.1
MTEQLHSKTVKLQEATRDCACTSRNPPPAARGKPNIPELNLTVSCTSRLGKLISNSERFRWGRPWGVLMTAPVLISHCGPPAVPPLLLGSGVMLMPPSYTTPSPRRSNDALRHLMKLLVLGLGSVGREMVWGFIYSTVAVCARQTRIRRPSPPQRPEKQSAQRGKLPATSIRASKGVGQAARTTSCKKR